MVTQSQVRNAAPVLSQIDALTAAITAINVAAAAGNWVLAGPLYFHDGSGNTQLIDLTNASLPTANLLNSLFSACQTQLSALQSQLSGI